MRLFGFCLCVAVVEWFGINYLVFLFRLLYLFVLVRNKSFSITSLNDHKIIPKFLLKGAPQLLETTAESFDQFIRQFQRYLRVEDVDAN